MVDVPNDIITVTIPEFCRVSGNGRSKTYELLAKGKDVTAERVDGADHGFCKPGEESGPPTGIQKVFSHVLTWFFAKPKTFEPGRIPIGPTIGGAAIRVLEPNGIPGCVVNNGSNELE